MLRLTARRTGTATRRLHDFAKPNTVTALPRGMQRFHLPSAPPAPAGGSRDARMARQPPALQPSPNDGGSALSSSSASSPLPSSPPPPSKPLPPWPADAIEFNALCCDGGQAAREAWQRHVRLGHAADIVNSAEDDGRAEAAVHAAASVPKTLFVTFETLERLAAAEEEAEAQAALAVGGWVCTGCWTVQGGDGASAPPSTTTTTSISTSSDLLPRTVCPGCHTLRHDVSTWSALSSALLQRPLWHCTECGEVNAHDPGAYGANSKKQKTNGADSALPSCRCCGHERSAAARESSGSSSNSLEQRRTIADETAQSAPGHIVVTRNRTTRWRCVVCNEVNSLQQQRCRNCDHERFGLTVCCPECETPRTLRNELVFGASPSARLNFSPSNCYTAASTQISCSQCHGPLHGGAVRTETSTGAPWWCACGVVNPAPAYCCYRCRLPRTVANPTLLRDLLRTATTPAPLWDFASCTSWFCDSCEGVNRSAYEIIVEDKTPAASPPTQLLRRRRRRWVDRNGGVCAHCGTVWHHQNLQGGELWRCACHAINTKGSTHCASCQLPALDTLGGVVLSAWTRGDWLCGACGTHCYRDRMRCRCGADRPSQ